MIRSWRTRRREILRRGARARRAATLLNGSVAEKTHNDTTTTLGASSRHVQSPESNDRFCTFFMAFLSSVSTSILPFGVFFHKFVQGKLDVLQGRCRDALPLCKVDSQRLAWPLGISMQRRQCLEGMLNMWGAGINFLYHDFRCRGVPASLSSVQVAIYQRVLEKLVRFATTFDTGDEDCPIQGAFGRIVGRGKSEKLSNFKADAIDLLPRCACLDPTIGLDATAGDVVKDPQAIFPGGVACLPRSCAFMGNSRREYVQLVVRQLLAQKVALTTKPLVSSGIFAVGKRDGVRQREVWNGSALSACAARPPRPPLLPNPAALANLECSADQPLRLSVRDGKIFFDQLALNPNMYRYFGRPWVSLQELLEAGMGEMELSEVQRYCLDDVDLGGADCTTSDPNLWPTSSVRSIQLTPVSLCWPMGFTWSSYIAQSMMVHTCKTAGFREHQFVTEANVLLAQDGPHVSVATDDVGVFQRVSSTDPCPQRTSELDELDRTWSELGLQSNTDKAVDLVALATILGVVLQNGVSLAPRLRRTLDLFAGILDLIKHPMASPAELASFGGMVQWHNLLGRPLYSCLHEYYAFVGDASDTSQAVVPRKVLSELLVNLCLFQNWEADLQRPWLPMLPCTDASASHGFGLCITRCSPALTREVASHCSSCDFFRLTRCQNDPPERPRCGHEFRLPLRIKDFKPTLSIKARVFQHSGGLEAKAVVIGLKRLARNKAWHAHRGAFLLDAQAVQGALNKGRTSAGTMRHAVMQVAALTLACDWKWHYGYLPSESMPADWPSRGQRYENRRPRASHVLKPTSLERMIARRRRAVRRLAKSRVYSDFWDCVANTSTNSSSLCVNYFN